MTNEHITDERAAFEAWAAREYRHATVYTKRDFEIGLEAWQARAALRPAAQPPKHKHWSAALADDLIASGDVPAPQTWDANQIALVCTQAEISDGHCQSLLIALEESNRS